MQTARSVCFAALQQVSENEGYSHIVLDKALRGAGLEKRDAALCSTLFYGVLEKQVTLDYAISCFLTKPYMKIEGGVRDLLRMAFYQILFMDRIPESAAVNEAINIAKATGREKYAGFMNGVLRSFLRSPEKIKPPAQPLQRLSVEYAIPAPLIAMWRDAYGSTVCQKLLESFTQRAPLFVRANTCRIWPEELTERLREEAIEATAEAVPGALRLSATGESVAQIPAFAEGLFHVQDLSSQLLCALLNARPGETVIDVCAAPGGKTCTIAQHMENTGEVIACDLYTGRVRLIAQAAQRLGLTNVRTVRRDATKPDDALPQADRVLCDVPCSGYGVIRRKPEIRQKPLTDAQKLPETQLAILHASARLVKPGGVLVYSTCTLHPKENGEVAAAFLQAHKEFSPLPLTLPQGVVRGIQEPENQLTMLPYMLGTDGFFVAAFRKNK